MKKATNKPDEVDIQAEEELKGKTELGFNEEVNGELQKGLNEEAEEDLKNKCSKGGI
jgi:hypothetical protein